MQRRRRRRLEVLVGHLWQKIEERLYPRREANGPTQSWRQRHSALQVGMVLAPPITVHSLAEGQRRWLCAGGKPSSETVEH